MSLTEAESINKGATSQTPWMVGAKGGPGGQTHSIVNGQGRVVAAMVPNTADAKAMAVACELLECCKGADALISYLMETNAVPELLGDEGEMTRQLLRDIRAAIARTK